MLLNLKELQMVIAKFSANVNPKENKKVPLTFANSELEWD